MTSAMTNNGYSDSQESALFDDETFKDIQKQVGSDLELLMQNTKELIPEQQEPYKFDHETSEYNLRENGQEVELEDEEEKFSRSVMKQLNDNTLAVELNFDYHLADGGRGQDWVYSETLDKVFIKMDKILPLRFTWDVPLGGLYLRTAMAFKLDQYRSDPVRRCHNHMADIGNNQNMDPQRIKHVVHCINHTTSIYEEQNEHLSILTPLNEPEFGMPCMLMCYKFLCKNSCSSGMNRRPTELVFSLEDHRKCVLGRRKLLVRVCSCPKRDKQKEEMETSPSVCNNKRKALMLPMLPAKKIQSSCDKHVFKVELDIPGKENYLAVLKYAYDIMAGQAIKTGQYEFFKPFMESILQKTP